MTARIDPFITHCLAMMFGITAYFTAPIDPPSLLLPLPENPVAAAFGLAAACGGLLAVYLYVWAHRHLHIGHPLALRGLLLLIAVFFGFIYAHGFALVQARALAPLPAQVNSVETAPRLFRGRIIWVEPRPNGGLVNLAITDNAGRQIVLRLYTSRARIARLHPGCLTTLSASVRPLEGPLVRGGYDPRFTGFFNGRAGQGFIREIGQVDCAAPMSAGEHWRMGLADFRLRLAMPVGLEPPFMALMSFGIKSVLVVADWLTAYPGAVFYRGQSAPAVLPPALTGLSVACLANGRCRYAGFGFIGLALLLAGRADRPIIYVYGVGQAVMYESSDGGLHVLRSGRRAYEIGLWQRTQGHGGDDAPIEDAPCSESVCFYPLMDGRQFAYMRAGRGLSEACSKADLVLAPFIEARYPCRAFLVDRRHLTKGRAVTVMQAQSGYEIVEPARAGRRIRQAYCRPRPDDG